MRFQWLQSSTDRLALCLYLEEFNVELAVISDSSWPVFPGKQSAYLFGKK